MYLIAHCDDETAELNKIEQMLTTYREQYAVCDFQIERFQSADDLLRMVREEEYMPDLLLMDIYMRGKLGTEAARELREMGSHCRIIFLTASQEHALEAFQVDAMQYLLKPIYEKNLFPVLDRALEEIEQEKRRYLLLRIDSSIRRIARGRWLSGAGAAAAAFLPEAAALAPEGPVRPGLLADSGVLPSPPGFSDRGAFGWRLSARRRPGQGSSVRGRSSVRRWHRIQRQSPVRWRNPIQGRRPSRSPAR